MSGFVHEVTWPKFYFNSIHGNYKDLDIMAYKMDKGHIYRGLILRNELSSKNYDTDFLFRYNDIKYFFEK